MTLEIEMASKKKRMSARMADNRMVTTEKRGVMITNYEAWVNHPHASLQYEGFV